MRTWQETIYIALFGVSLTLFLASTLFVLVAINPKQSIFGNMPWIYAGLSLIASLVCYLISRRFQPKSND